MQHLYKVSCSFSKIIVYLVKFGSSLIVLQSCHMCRLLGIYLFWSIVSIVVCVCVLKMWIKCKNLFSIFVIVNYNKHFNAIIVQIFTWIISHKTGFECLTNNVWTWWLLANSHGTSFLVTKHKSFGFVQCMNIIIDTKFIRI